MISNVIYIFTFKFFKNEGGLKGEGRDLFIFNFSKFGKKVRPLSVKDIVVVFPFLN